MHDLKLYISNQRFDAEETKANLESRSTMRTSVSWMYQLVCINESMPTFRFYGEPGIYYFYIDQENYFPITFTVNVKKSDQKLNITLNPKVKDTIPIKTFNLFDMRPMEGVLIEVFNEDTFVTRAITNSNGVADLQLDMMSTYRVVCTKEGYITLSQYYITTSSSLLEGINIQMIPFNRSPNSQDNLEFIALFNESHQISIYVVCPGKN